MNKKKLAAALCTAVIMTGCTAQTAEGSVNISQQEKEIRSSSLICPQADVFVSFSAEKENRQCGSTVHTAVVTAVSPSESARSPQAIPPPSHWDGGE